LGGVLGGRARGRAGGVPGPLPGRLGWRPPGLVIRPGAPPLPAPPLPAPRSLPPPSLVLLPCLPPSRAIWVARGIAGPEADRSPVRPFCPPFPGRLRVLCNRPSVILIHARPPFCSALVACFVQHAEVWHLLQLHLPGEAGSGLCTANSIACMGTSQARKVSL
jgi:hypothetical protein